MYERFLMSAYMLESQLLLQDGDNIGFIKQGLELLKLMLRHSVDKLDIFEHSLSVAKTVNFVLEGEHKEDLEEIPL